MISASIITKNEEHNIQRCLDSIQWVDEVVVVDSGSTDKTLEICRSYNCKIIETEWLGFGRTKQLAVDAATYEWVLSIDADEEVTTALKDTILATLNKPKADGYTIKRSSYYLKRLIKYSGWQNDYPLRLFNKNAGQFNDAPVHETVVMNSNNLSSIEAPLFHYPYPTIESHIQKINLYSSLGANKLFQQGKQHTILFAFSSGGVKFIKMYIFKKGFLDGKEGFILSLLSAFGASLKYIKLSLLIKNKQAS